MAILASNKNCMIENIGCYMIFMQNTCNGQMVVHLIIQISTAAPDFKSTMWKYHRYLGEWNDYYCGGRNNTEYFHCGWCCKLCCL